MTYQSYSRGIRLIFAILAPLFLLQQIGKALLEGQHEYSMILALMYFAVRIVTLYLLFFSIYAFLMKIKNVRKLESPAIFIILGTIFVILSYGPPIVAYSISRNQTDFKYSQLPAHELKSEIMNVNTVPSQRLELVRNYYLDTGEQLTYLDDRNRTTIYNPDDTAFKLYQATRKLKLSMANLRITALTLSGLLAVSVICFAIYLWYRLPHQTNNQI